MQSKLHLRTYYYLHWDIKRNFLIVVCSQCSINYLGGILTLTVYYTIMLQASCYNAEGN